MNTLLLLAIALLLIWVCLIEPNWIKIRQKKVCLSRWKKDLDGLNVVILSDLHTGSPFNGLDKLETIVKKVNTLEPDLVLLLGDFVIKGMPLVKPLEPDPIVEKLSHIKSTLGVVAIMGNHDYRYGASAVRDSFKKYNIPLIENDAIPFNVKGSRFWVAGIPDFDTAPYDIEQALRNVDNECPVLMMVHNPYMFTKLPDRFSMCFAGDTHAGQIYPFLIGDFLLKLKNGFQYIPKYRYGLVKEGDTYFYTTSGLGVTFLPARFRALPEIVSFHLYMDAL